MTEGEAKRGRKSWQRSGREGKEAEPPRGTGSGGAVLRLAPGELCPAPSMQFPTGPACIFLRKGIAEKQRVSLGTMREDGGQGKGSWDAGKRRDNRGAGGESMN